MNGYGILTLKLCDIPGLQKKPLTPWIMLSYWESLNSMGSVLKLLTCSGPIYLTESNKRLLMELNLISIM